MRPAPPKDPRATLAQVGDVDEEDDLYASAPRRPLASDTAGSLSLVIPPTIEAGAVPSVQGFTAAWQWLPMVDANGRLEVSCPAVESRRTGAELPSAQIFLLPSMQPVFSSSAIALFPEVIEDGGEAVIPAEVDEDDVIVDRIVCANIGQTRLRPHLIVSRPISALSTD